MTQPDLDQLTADQIANMPDAELLDRAASAAREYLDDLGNNADEDDRLLAGAVFAAARAARTGRADDHRVVTQAVAAMARALLRTGDSDDQADPAGSTT